MSVFSVFLMFKQMPLNMRSFLQTEVVANEATFIDSHTFTDTNTHTHTLSLSLSLPLSLPLLSSLLSLIVEEEGNDGHKKLGKMLFTKLYP